jgi:DNA-directed RNA polymerase subunit RPC12/RpoP
MSPQKQLALALILIFIGTTVGFFALGFSILILFGNIPGYWQLPILSACGMLGFFSVKVLFTRYVHATCPKCHGKVFPQGSFRIPVLYLCSNCGFQEEIQSGMGTDV